MSLVFMTVCYVDDNLARLEVWGTRIYESNFDLTLRFE